jgi:CRP-like cAMP-binding protein
MAIEDDIALLERVPSLALLGREALRILAIGAENRYLHNGEVLFREDESSDAGYLVQEGWFKLTSEGRGEDGARFVGPGKMIGELALLIETRCAVTAMASEPSTVIRIPRSLFLKMLESYPDAAARLRTRLLQQAEQAAREMHTIRERLEGSHDDPDDQKS